MTQPTITRPITRPIIESAPGETVPLAALPEDPGKHETHGLCPICFPNPRVGDWVKADCGYVERSFPGWPTRRRRRRRAKPTCLGCLRVYNGVAQPACPHRLRL